MAVNITSIKTSSNGVWEGDNPLHFAFPLLIVQATLILLVTRLLAVIFKPLRQPKVIAEIVGGIVLGPSAFGRNKTYMNAVFPKWSSPILESVASIGLLFFLFLVGLELDLNSIRRSGRRAFFIAVAGISAPFISGAGVAVVFRKTIDGADKVGYSQFLVFMGVALSITAFPVLARILAELKLLTTRVGETAMAAAAFNDVAAWILLALAIALAGNGEKQTSPIISVWVLLCGAAFIVFMAVVIRPIMGWVARRCSSEHDAIDEAYIGLTLTGVLVSGFMTDLIGIHSIFGAFVFGLMIPKEGGFAGKLMERIEDFVSGLLLPLYFATSGLKTDVATIQGAEAWGLLVLVITVACAGKIIGTFVMALCCKIPAREAITLGVLMNTKGLVELIVLNIGREKKVLNDEMFAILVLMALFTTFITTPTVMAIYKPARPGGAPTHKRKLQGDSSTHVTDESVSPSTKVDGGLRILSCLHGPGNVPATISLVESIRSTAGSRLKLYAMHLLELTERSSSIALVQRLRRNGLPFTNRRNRGSREVHDQVAYAFEAYGQLGRVMVRPITTISALSTMHEDICHVAEQKEVALIVLPFHKTWRPNEDNEGLIVDNVGQGWRGVNQRVMKHAACSVAVLVDRGFGSARLGEDGAEEGKGVKKVCLVFFGGPDDREALELGGRMAEHPALKVVVIRFTKSRGNEQNDIRLMPSPEKSRENSYSFSVATMNREEEMSLDEVAIGEFRKRWQGTAEYTERTAGNLVEDVLGLGKSGEYDLIVVGKGRFPSTMVAGLAELAAENAELGPVGDILTSNINVGCSVLVVQQHDLAHVEEVPVSKVVHNEEAYAGEIV
ncbi:hypothetical protein V2J09_010445 [Rumex salicifolius]